MSDFKYYRWLHLYKLMGDDVWRFREKKYTTNLLGHWLCIDDYQEQGKMINIEFLKMIHPQYDWDKIAKMYNEAPRSQK